MTEHQNVAVVRRAMQAMNETDMSRAEQEMGVVEAFMADDIEWHEIGRAEPRHGKAELRTAMMEGARDWTITYDVHDVIANDDHAIVLGTATATRGDRTLSYRTTEIFDMLDGKATERWAMSDDTAAIEAFFA